MAKSLQEKKLPVECYRVAYWVLCFFLVFINDLPDYCVNLKTMLLADDAKLISSGQAQEQSQSDKYNVNKYNVTMCLIGPSTIICPSIKTNVRF